MRFCTFLLALVIGAASAVGQETFAPLITENTVLFIHIDLQKAEIDTVKQNWKTYSEGLMKSLHFEALPLKAALSALDKDLDKLDEYIRPAFETITHKLGIKEIAIIMDTELLSEGEPAVFAIPWKGKTDADLETLLSLFPEPFFGYGYRDNLKDCFVVGKDCLILGVDSTDEAAEVRKWLDNAKPAPDGAIMQAMKSLGNDDIKIAAAMTETAREYLLETLKETDEFPEPVLNILTYVARKVDWVATSFSNPLFTPSVMEEMPPLPLLKLTVKTRTASDAKMLRTMLESSIDLGITAWRTAMMAAAAVHGEEFPELPQFFYEFARGYARSLLPVVEGDKLIFQTPDFGGRYNELNWLMVGGMWSAVPFMVSTQHASRAEDFIGEDFDLHGKTMQNKEFDWNAYRGKYVLVKFTATWCGPCKLELPGMLEAYEKYHDKGLEIVSVYIWEAEGDVGNNMVNRFVLNEKIPWTIISEPLTEKANQPLQSDTFAKFIDGVPTMLIVDKEGKIFATDTRGAKLKRILEELFEE